MPCSISMVDPELQILCREPASISRALCRAPVRERTPRLSSTRRSLVRSTMRTSRPQKRSTSRAGSPPSRAKSERRSSRATICTASSSSDDRTKTGQIVPFSFLDGNDPEDLLAFMAGYEEKTGGSVLALAHNGNLSNGRMFAPTALDGSPLTRNYAERRAKWAAIRTRGFMTWFGVTPIVGNPEPTASCRPWAIP